MLGVNVPVNTPFSEYPDLIKRIENTADINVIVDTIRGVDPSVVKLGDSLENIEALCDEILNGEEVNE